MRAGSGGCLPNAELAHLLDSAQEEATFHAAKVVDEQGAFEVIDLMTNGLSECAFGLDLPPISASVLRSDPHLGRALDVGEEARKGKASLFEGGLSASVNDRGVCEDDFCLRVPTDRQIDGREAKVDSDLRRGKAETRCFPSGSVFRHRWCPAS